jgi:phage tail sheath protein FI
MPLTPTYPGIYVEELPGPVPTIPGVSTSDTAFVDFFKRGPTDRAVQITSFNMFERIFGGLDERSEASYAIMQFFLNGGAVAWVCRAIFDDQGKPAGTKNATATKGHLLASAAGSPQAGLTIEAANPGSWGNFLQVAVDYNTLDNQPHMASHPTRVPHVYPASFNLAVRELDPTRTQVVSSEVYRNLVIDPTSPNYCIDVINNASSLIRIPTNEKGLYEDPPLGIPAPTCDNVMTDLNTVIKTALVGTPPHQQRLQVPVGDYLDLYPDVTHTSPYFPPEHGSPSHTESVTPSPYLGYSPPQFSPLGQIYGETPGCDGTPPKCPATHQLSSWWVSPTASNGSDPGPLVRGWQLLDHIAPFVFNILCLPVAGQFTGGQDEVAAAALYLDAANFCQKHQAFVIVDPPIDLVEPTKIIDWRNNPAKGAQLSQMSNTAVYFPSFTIPNPLNKNRPRKVSPSGTLAGIYARTDAAIGVWKAPAGIDAGLLGGVTLATKVTDAEDGLLNPLGINALRTFPVIGDASWGTRTIQGSDIQESQWKYIPVRRLAFFIEQSLIEGLKWAVFEPNAEPLWSSIRLEVGTFMAGLAREGAFENYAVTCDATTTTPEDQANGIVVVLVAFKPIYPAEFVVIQIKQLAGGPPAA